MGFGTSATSPIILRSKGSNVQRDLARKESAYLLGGFTPIGPIQIALDMTRDLCASGVRTRLVEALV